MGPGFSMSSYTMLWYRQSSYRAPLEFLTMEYAEGAGRFQPLLDASKNNFSLQIAQLLPEDSSTYYCAASHSDADGTGGCTNISKKLIEHEQEGNGVYIHLLRLIHFVSTSWLFMCKTL